MFDLVTEILDSVELAVGDEPPTEFLLFKSGDNATKKGNFVFSERSALAVMSEFSDSGLDALPFDASHLMLTSDNPEAKKALGWFRPEVRGGELWAADAKWTPKTREALINREYRFHSPAIKFDGKTREILSLVNVALTNLPATKNQTPLMLSEGDEKEEPMKLFECLGASDEGSALVALDALKSELSEAKARVAELIAQSVSDKRAAEIERLSASGKLPPALRGFAEKLSLEQLSEFAAALPDRSERVEEPKGEGAATLSTEERQAAKLAGVSEADYLAQKIEIEKRNAARKEG